MKLHRIKKKKQKKKQPHPERTIWGFAIWRHIVLVKRSMSGHSFLKPWQMNPGLESMCHYLVWTSAKKQNKRQTKSSLCLLLQQD